MTARIIYIGISDFQIYRVQQRFPLRLSTLHGSVSTHHRQVELRCLPRNFRIREYHFVNHTYRFFAHGILNVLKNRAAAFVRKYVQYSSHIVIFRAYLRFRTKLMVGLMGLLLTFDWLPIIYVMDHYVEPGRLQRFIYAMGQIL